MRLFLRLYILLFVLSVFNLSTKAQQSIIKNQTAYNLYLLNPAAVAMNNEFSVNCHYKKNWLGLAESPESIQLTMDGALLMEQHGIGLSLNKEQAGIFSKIYFLGTYRYKIKLNKKQNLSFGLSAGFQKQQSDFSKIKADSPEEFALWPKQQSTTIPDAAFGFVYTNTKFVIAGSVNQILKQDYTYKEPVYNSEFRYKTLPQFNFTAQHTFQINSDVLKYTPLLILRSTQGLPFQIDFVNTLLIKNRFMFGIGYRYLYAVYANLGCVITEKLRIIYSYEYSVGIQTTTKSGHEIGIRFAFGNDGKKTSSKSSISAIEIEDILMKLDQQDLQIGTLTQKLDTLDKNTKEIKLQVLRLKDKQVDPIEIKSILEKCLEDNSKSQITESTENSKQKNSTNSGTSSRKYKVINSGIDSEQSIKEYTQGSKYQLVLGVYQLVSYAKEYQKHLEKYLKLKTKLIQLPNHPQNYIYVCALNEYEKLPDALKDLEKLRERIKNQTIELTRGEAWILQTLEN